MSQLPLEVSDVTADWLSAALSLQRPGLQVRRLSVDNVIWGTATKVFVTAEYEQTQPAPELPSRLCIKGGFTPELRPAMASGYQTESYFYRDLAPELSAGLPACYYAGVDLEHDQGIVVLADLRATGGTFLDPLAPLKVDLVADGLATMAEWHARTAADHGWMTAPSPLRPVMRGLFRTDHWAEYTGRLQGEAMARVFADRERTAVALERMWQLEDGGPRSLSHGDANVTNVYVDGEGCPRFLDWQFARFGSWAGDVALFMISALSVEDRRAHAEELMRDYLARKQARGGPSQPWDQAWSLFATSALYGAMYAIVPDEMQPAAVRIPLAERFVAAVDDYRTLDLLSR